MIGAITGDIIGSIYERSDIKTTEFPLFDRRCRFTDDTVLTIALAERLLTGADYVTLLKDYFWRYPNAGYGGTFIHWARSDDRNPYNSWGNGSAMRVSPVGWAFDTLAETLKAAEESAAVTHNHPQGIKGAQAIACAIFLARTEGDRSHIRTYIEDRFGYNLSARLDDIRPTYAFDVSCQGSVPQALIAFLESSSYEDAVRKAISLGGDSDTLACMAGSVAHAFYGGVPAAIQEEALARLDAPLRDVVDAFANRYNCG